MKGAPQPSTSNRGLAFALASLCVLWLTAALATTAHADALAKPTNPIAHEHLKHGNRYYRQREFEKAIEEYKLGAAREAAPVFHYNLGQCFRKLHRYREALWHYEIFLRHGEPTGEVEAAVQTFIAEMKRELEKAATEQPAIEPAPSAAASFKRLGQPSSATRVGVGAGDGAGAEPLAVTRSSGAVWSMRRKLAAGLAGGAVIALAAGGALGASAKSQQRETHALCPDPRIGCDDADRANELSRSAHNRAIGANAAFAVGGAAAIAATVLWLTGAPEPLRRVAIVPEASAGQLAFTASGRF